MAASNRKLRGRAEPTFLAGFPAGTIPATGRLGHCHSATRKARITTLAPEGRPVTLIARPIPSKTRYSIFSLARNALSYHENWEEAWRSPEPKAEYDVIIVGGGGHGLATAYYLAKEHGIANVAVLEKGWIGGGNTGRNTTVVRSNYLWDESAHLYEHALKLWEGLSRELNFNVMFSQRGLLNLAHSPHEMRGLARRVYV